MTNTNGTTDVAVTANGVNGAAPQANLGLVRPTDIVGEMQVAYLDYAMSVIVARALPDARDGLKPVHRRILYAMYADLGLTHDKPHKKSARVVGEVLGKYHPHGDVAVYDAMARMAQDFSLRYPLVDGQGNFGSIDGDSPAAMRYTEVRLAEISDLMLDDIEQDTVAWKDNFDNTLQEPVVLPAALPNLLINGASGIAVGMATNIPPHNLGEVVDALAYLIDHYAQIDEIAVEQLTHFIQGPDFPTGGIVYRYREDPKSEEQVDAIAQGYSVGKSRLVIQAKVHFEEMSRGRSRILITELPYQTNKATLLERIAELVRDGKLEGITDLRDESDRTGMRVVIELTRNVEPKTVLADLFKYTPLQQTFGLQLLALVDGQPRMLSLKRLLHLFVQHREEIVRRRSEFELARARERAHILEGLLKALDMLDEIIDTIRRSQRVETARTNLIEKFGFSEIQAQAILDMQLRRLAALERKKLQDEYKDLKDRIKYLEDLLAHPEKILALIKAELLAIKEKYGDARRTQIVDSAKATLTATDLLPDQEVWVSVGSNGELRRQEVGRVTATTLRQIGKGSEVAVVTANTRDTLYLFSADGRCVRVLVHEIPQDGNGRHVSELSKFTRSDKLVAALTLPHAPTVTEAGQGYLFLTTVQGIVKRIALSDLPGPNAVTVISVDNKDRLGWAFATDGNQEVILATASGQAIRFAESEVRSMGLSAGGVGGIKLKGRDTLVYAGAVDPAGELITITQQGYAKRSVLTDYPVQGRNGGGIVTHKVSDRTGQVSTALVVGQTGSNETLIMVTRKGVVKLVTLADISVMGRSVQGKPVAELGQNDSLATIKRIITSSPSASERPTNGASAPPASTATPETPVVSTRPSTVRAPVTTPSKLEIKATPATTPTRRAQAIEQPRDNPVKTQKEAVSATPPSKPPETKRSVNGTPERPSTTNAKVTVKATPAAKNPDHPKPELAPSARTQTRQRAVEAKDAATKQTTIPVKPVRTDVKIAATTPNQGEDKANKATKPPGQPPARHTNGDTPAAMRVGKAAKAPQAEGSPTQPTLFALETTPQPNADRTQKSKKVQAVVSVPASQAGKSKQRK